MSKEFPMPEYKIREYTEEEYKADMEKLLKDNGLRNAVKIYLDKMDEETSMCGYVTHRMIQELACDILYLIELEEEG